MTKNKNLCNKCKVFLRKTYIGEYSEKFDYCISCPECHIVYDLIPKGQETLAKHNSQTIQSTICKKCHKDYQIYGHNGLCDDCRAKADQFMGIDPNSSRAIIANEVRE